MQSSNTVYFFRFVQSLLEAKLLIVNTESLSPDSTISVNLKYSNKRTKFRIPAARAMLKETPQEIKKAHHDVEKEREFFIQARIVRIMKSRQVLKHNALIEEVFRQSKVYTYTSYIMYINILSWDF